MTRKTANIEPKKGNSRAGFVAIVGDVGDGDARPSTFAFDDERKVRPAPCRRGLTHHRIAGLVARQQREPAVLQAHDGAEAAAMEHRTPKDDAAHRGAGVGVTMIITSWGFTRPSCSWMSGTR